MVVFRVVENGFNHFGNQQHEVFLRTTSRHGWSTKTNTAGLESRTSIEWHHVLVGCDVSSHESLLCHLTRQVRILRAEVHQHRVVVCTARADEEATVDECLSQCGSILLHLLLIFHELWLESLTECNCLSSNHVLQWTTLLAREHSRIQNLRHHLHLSLWCSQAPRVFEILAEEDNTTSRTAQRLMCSRSNDMSVLQWVVEQASGNQTSWVSHVNHQEGTHLVSNLTHASIVPFAAISRTATNNQLWLILQSETFHLIIIHTACLLIQVVANRTIKDTGSIHMATVRKVASVVEVQTHERVTWFQHAEQHSGICLSTRVRLNIGKFSTEQLLYALNGNRLHLVNHFASAVVALAWITFSILVGEARTLSCHHLVAHIVLTGNEFHSLYLSLMFLLDERKNFDVSFHFLKNSLLSKT